MFMYTTDLETASECGSACLERECGMKWIIGISEWQVCLCIVWIL